MKITYHVFNNDTYVNIYLSSNENLNEIKDDIDTIKKQYKHVAIFVGGEKNYKETLKQYLT